MTDQQHPITPPPELVEQWRIAPEYGSVPEVATMVTMTARRLQEIATQSAQWGYEQRAAVNEAELQKARDEELEACVEWVINTRACDMSPGSLRTARRPKLKSQAEEALEALDDAVLGGDCITTSSALPTIRAALKRLQELEGEQ